MRRFDVGSALGLAEARKKAEDWTLLRVAGALRAEACGRARAAGRRLDRPRRCGRSPIASTSGYDAARGSPGDDDLVYACVTTHGGPSAIDNRNAEILVHPVDGLVRGFEIADFVGQSVAERLRLVRGHHDPWWPDELALPTGFGRAQMPKRRSDRASRVAGENTRGEIDRGRRQRAAGAKRRRRAGGPDVRRGNAASDAGRGLRRRSPARATSTAVAWT